MSKRRGHIQHEGPPIVMPDGGTLVRSNNLREWVSFNSGASLVDWNGEEDVVLLGYDPLASPGYLSYTSVKNATFTVSRDVGPTASAICSEVHLVSDEACSNVTDSYYWLWDGTTRSPTTLQSDFTATGSSPLDNAQKPSQLQMLIAVWFEYDGPEHPITGNNGVFEIGVGGGDLVFIENLTSGGKTWWFSNANELVAGSLPQSSSWCGGNSAASRPWVTWLQMPVAESDTFRISVVPPGWGHAQAGADINASPEGLRYYTAVYVVEGCSLLGGGLVPGEALSATEMPVLDRICGHVWGASDGSVRL